VAVDVEHATFEEWWEPFTLGVAPSGAHVAGLEPGQRTALRELCRERLPEPPFVVSAKAWVARGAACRLLAAATSACASVRECHPSASVRRACGAHSSGRGGLTAESPRSSCAPKRLVARSRETLEWLSL